MLENVRYVNLLRRGQQCQALSTGGRTQPLIEHRHRVGLWIRFARQQRAGELDGVGRAEPVSAYA